MSQIERAKGVDISVWQDNNSTPQMFDPWKARSMGATFAGIKVSQANWADPDYAQNWANLRGVLYRMPYHFLTWDVSPFRQAEVFWSLLERDPGELPLICDFEWWRVVPANAMDMLYNFTYRLKQLSDPLEKGVYSSFQFWKESGSAAEYWKQFCLWLCDITGPVEVPLPWETYDFHQFTFKLPGPAWGAESLDLDGDYYNGTLAQMMARFKLAPLFGLEEPEPEPQPEPGAALRLRVLASVLNVRSGSGTGYPVVGSLRRGEVIEVEGVDGGDAWVRTSHGWACVRNAFGRYMEAAEELPSEKE